ncbi:endonuclease/exonuclease/phosphatase family protein [Jatrophihabitans sp.]|uniref:endonuclease/exonuclease/phosphatase family protein n=1 Tax=Jatrophihabitans sp. TaxID=1932789 RepID=UPI0030C76F6D|nr:Endonuclease/exonuclease/phosphatase [Jatrophihabitans sp.]
MPNLRLLSYNVRSMRDDRAALARVIRSAEADVVVVQEAPRFARWRSLCAELARTSNLVVVGGGRPAGANLVLSSLGVDVTSTTDVLFSKQPRLHQRGAVLAQLVYRGAPLAVAGIHLSLDATERARHVGELDVAIGRVVPAGVPLVVAGDINDVPGSTVWTALAATRDDAFGGGPHPFTSTAASPAKTIDGVFVDRRLSVVSASVLSHPEAAAASDHLPVLVELSLPE